MLVRYASARGGTTGYSRAKRGCKTGLNEPPFNAFVPQARDWRTTEQDTVVRVALAAVLLVRSRPRTASYLGRVSVPVNSKGLMRSTGKEDKRGFGVGVGCNMLTQDKVAKDQAPCFLT